LYNIEWIEWSLVVDVLEEKHNDDGTTLARIYLRVFKMMSSDNKNYLHEGVSNFWGLI